MSDYIIEFDLTIFHQLDEYALLACQDYNYGGESGWFGSFRGGLYGSYARVHGVCNHYHSVHAWMLRPRIPSETEYHLASLFFNMDSLIECITYALNALGFCASGDRGFRDITCERSLRRISPLDILGRPNSNPPQPHLEDYDHFFPELRKYWESKKDMINMVFEQHDVSKHRETIFTGGKCRNDPPEGFYESLGIGPEESSKRALFWPMEEIIIKRNPKIPQKDRTPQPIEGRVLLEELVPEFKEFIEITGRLALDDARKTIILKVKEFEKA